MDDFFNKGVDVDPWDYDAEKYQKQKEIERRNQYYDSSRYEEIMNRPNSGKVVNPRLNYFSYVELKTFDVRPYLSNVTIPAFIYCGRYDAQCPHVFSQEAADLMPNATMTTFELSNHNPFVEEEEKFKQFVAHIVG